jgi:hypothetical protein
LKIKKQFTRKDFLYFVGLLTLTVIFFGKIIGTRNIVLSSPDCDIASSFFAYRWFGFRNLGQGILPLWNPYIASGVPFMAGMESALFYPLNLIYLILPIHLAINYGIILHLFLSGVFFYSFIRYLHIDRFAAFVASVVYMFSATGVCHIYAGHLTVLSVSAWIPLLFLFTEKYFRENKFLYIFLTSLVLTLQILAGYIQIAYYTTIGFAFYFFFRIILFYRDRRKAFPVVRHSLAFIILAAAGLLLAAVQLIPALELAQHSIRSLASYEFCASFSFPPENFITFLLPEFFGNNIGLTYWGRWSFWEMCTYLGILPLIFVAFALAFRRDKYTFFFGLLGGLSLLLALGRYTPLFKFLYIYMPGFNLFRGTSKFIFLSTFSLATLSGFGLQALLQKKPFQRMGHLRFSRLLVVVTIILALVLGFFIFWVGRCPSLWRRCLEGFASLERETLFPLDLNNLGVFTSTFSLVSKSILKFLVFLIGAALFLFFHTRKILKKGITRVMILLLVVADLWLFGFKYLVNFPLETNFGSRAVVNFLGDDPDYYRILDSKEPLLNWGMINGIANIAGLDATNLRWYNEFINASQGIDLDHPRLHLSFDEVSRPLNLLNLKYILLRPNLEVKDPQFNLVFRSPEMNIYQNRDFLPRAYIVHKTKVITSRDAILQELKGPAFQPRDCVVLEDSSSPSPDSTAAPDTGKAPLPRITEYQPNKVVVRATLLRSGYLILADTYYPGWEAYVDGREEKIYRANYVQRALYLEPGEHRIEFVYRPYSFRVGLVVSLLTACAFAVALVWSLKRRD